MSQPTKYTQNYDYSDELTTTSVPGSHGAHLDTEFAELKSTTDQIITNLALIQRDDGELANLSVHKDALSAEVLALLVAGGTPRGDWATATSYAVGDLVGQSGSTYICVTAHTSGTFSTDEAAGKWLLFAPSETTIQNQAAQWLGTGGGTADVITATATPTLTAYAAGQTFRFISSGANTGAVTINIDSLGAKAITKHGSTALAANEIPSGALVEIVYDGTQFQFVGVVLLSALALPSGSSKVGFSHAETYAAGTLGAKAKQVVSVKDAPYSATGDGSTDDTAAIQAAIDAVTTAGGTVFFPAGIYRVTQLLLKSYVTLRGIRRENGWARIANFNYGSVIRSTSASGLSPIKIVSPSTNWGIEDIVIDADKANQTAPGVHCIEHKRTSATGSPGGLIKGVKCVNPTGFGAYIMGAHPLEISESFFMSGIYLGKTYDTLISGCSIDGTDSIHPALWMGQSEHINIDGNFIFRGESVSATVSQTYTVDTAADTITVTDASAFYDGQPVTLTAATTFPEMTNASAGTHRGNDTFLVKKVSGNIIQLWWGNDDASTGEQVLFNTAGVGTQTISSGVNDIIHITRGTHLRIADSRVAGSPGGALNAALCTYLQYDNNDHWALNWDDSATQPAVKLTGVQNCTLSNGQLGDSIPPAGKTAIREAVLIQDDSSAPAGATSVSENNILIGNQYRATQGLFVNDLSTAAYENRNIIEGWSGQYGQTANRIFSPQNRREPGRHYYSATTSTATVADSTNTTFTWAPVTKGDPAGIGSGTSLTVTSSANSLINVKGKIGFSNRVVGAHYVLLLVAVGGVSHRFVWEQESNTSKPSYIVIPFDVSQVVTSDTTVSVTVFQNSGSTLNVATGTDYTQLCITKVADYLA